MNEAFYQELIESGWIHRPLPLHPERSLEGEGAGKRVLSSRRVPMGAGLWTTDGPCRLSPIDNVSGAYVRLSAVSPVGERPSGDLEEGDCFNLGSIAARLEVGGENWEEYNRVVFHIRPRCEGIRKVHIGVQFFNEGVHRVPDIYNRAGFHTVNLANNRWNDCLVEIPSLPRDRITAMTFSVFLNGCETDVGLGNRLEFDIASIALARVERPEHDLGWTLDPGEIAWSYSGYRTRGAKRAVIAARKDCPFEVQDENGRKVLEGVARVQERYPGIALADFSSLREEGQYRLVADGSATDLFPIGGDVLIPSAWKALNFLFCQRCGYPVPGQHLSCHRDLLAIHGGRSMVMNGGWHDAGDLSQQLIQTAEVTGALFELAGALRGHKEQLPLRLRLMEEAQWGLDYLLRSRFGDGYRATSVGMSMWTQGFLGDKDDVRMRVHNNAFENFLCAGVEVQAANALSCSDPDLAARTLAAAEADFHFAREKFAQTGFAERPPVFWEHSYMTPESVFSAVMARSAALLYARTGQADYAECAAAWAKDALACQQTEPVGELFPEGGFFWRSRARQVPVHFNHQSRSHVFAQMFEALLHALPDHRDAPLWREAAERHAAYLRRLFAEASPYGMMPAGLYHERETDDRESFSRQHLLTGPEAYDDCIRQLRAGRELGGGWYLRQFPVWFSFRGNNAVLLSDAKAASILGRLLKDESLTEAACAQIYWNLGLNPFRQSLMYGEGRRYACQYAVLPGESTGELPVGVQTRDNEDEPWWPQMNNCTYKEIWTTPAARWMSVLSDLV